MKKILSLILVIAFVITAMAMPVLADNIFPDVTEESYPWAVTEINDMVEQGIIKGYTDGTFKPDKSVTKMESLVLVSRILGYTNQQYADFAALATELYADALEAYDIIYKGEVAFLMYKGVLKENELKYYIGEANVNMPLKRYEAAVLLTKAMGAEGNVGGSEMPYTDADEIPATAKDYVAFVSEVGLMNGMNKTEEVNEFVPNFEVNRAQIAVLLYRMMGIVKENIAFGTVTDVNSNTKTIMFLNADGTSDGISLPFDKEVPVKIDGYASDISKVAPASKIAVIRRDGELYAIEVMTVIPDEKVEGIVTSVITTTANVKLTVEKTATGEKTEYIVGKDVAVVYEGNIGNISDIKRTDWVELEIKEGTVVLVQAKAKERTIKGTVSSMVFDPEFKFQILLADGGVEEYSVADETNVKRNGTAADITDVLVGDKVTIVLAYEKIATVTATGKSSSATGTIEEFTVATFPTIKIRTSENNVVTYSIARDAVYEIDGVQDANIYSLRLGASISVKLESDTVVQIKSVSPTTNTSVLGTIVTINKAYGFFVLETTDSATGNVTQRQVFTKKKTLAVINGADGKAKTVNDLAAGMRVSVTGVESMGAFEATTIVIQP